MMSLFVLVMGGIYFGFFTPTEAAGIGAFGAFVITFIKKKINRATLLESLLLTGNMTAMIFLIIIGANNRICLDRLNPFLNIALRFII